MLKASALPLGTLVLWAAQASAQTPPPRADATPLDPRRNELAGFPIIGGNTDVGVQFGAATTFTRFYDEARPYLWNVDLLLSASLKSDQNGVRLVQQSHVLRLDAPDLLRGLLRVDTRASFQRTINAEYFGIGNASTAATTPGDPAAGRRYQYVQEEARVRVISRIHVRRPIDIALGTNLRYEMPSTYARSKLSEDATTRTSTGGPFIRGLPAAVLATISAGVTVDTRDTEFVTSRGLFYQIGMAGTVGSADQIAYGEASAVLSDYAPLGGPFVFASRLIGSFQVGAVPFYDLAQGGVFEPQHLLGSESGVRGVPQGRYAGLVKMTSNVEIRSTLPRFLFLRQSLRFGTTTFFDAGRVWSEYRYNPALDGRRLGLKFGVGGGVFLQWGEAAIFRVEAAYSPDAVSENPSFPVGIYVADGLMF